MAWQTSRFLIDLSTPKVMGIVNITPDSFSDGGQHQTVSAALRHCERLIREGADILDLGGESSRPGSSPVPLEEELARMLPVVREAVKLGVPVSVDTYKPQVMRVVLDLGADIINDIWALRQAGAADPLDAFQVVASHPSCGVCLMHMHGEPRTMQLSPMEGDVLVQVRQFLEHRARQLRQAGVAANRIVIDPGIGFGKTVAQNFALLSRQRELLVSGCPLLVGWSRKSSLAAVCGQSLGCVAALDAKDRMVASVTAALLAVERGASIVRVHDVSETVQALRVLGAIR
ncbi:dihydropteroate synthase [Rhodoferax sp.]|uniref:dihydropteroate synthase n=1 Tax=Rhodoferax sp. TaxID=50421 RepID=UPI002768E87D|nr:dihydropteroate synthase [Rhodoferax sp.]